MARNAEFKLPEANNKVLFPVSEARKIELKNEKPRTIKARDGDYIEIAKPGFNSLRHKHVAQEPRH